MFNGKLEKSKKVLSIDKVKTEDEVFFQFLQAFNVQHCEAFGKIDKSVQYTFDVVASGNFINCE